MKLTNTLYLFYYMCNFMNRTGTKSINYKTFSLSVTISSVLGIYDTLSTISSFLYHVDFTLFGPMVNVDTKNSLKKIGIWPLVFRMVYLNNTLNWLS